MNALQMEVKKNGLTQTQDGTWKLSLTVHPNDMPVELMVAPMGKIYMAALAAVGDDGQPEPKQEKPKKHWADLPRSQQAALRCQDGQFKNWLNHRDDINCYDITMWEESDDWAASSVRQLCDVDSRAEFDTDSNAALRWDKLDDQYRRDVGLEAEER